MLFASKTNQHLCLIYCFTSLEYDNDDIEREEKRFNDAMKVESRKSIIESEVEMRLQKSSEIRWGLSREIVVH
jgi:hypothetical protein